MRFVRRVSLLVAGFTLMCSLPVLGQDTQDDTDNECAAGNFLETVNLIIADYQSNQDDAVAPLDALSEATEFSTKIERAIERCTILLTERNGDGPVGDGSLQNPFGFGDLVDTGEGYTIRITNYIRPADNVIRNVNRFNDRPGTDEVYVIVELEVVCLQGHSSSCQTDYFDYQMVGDNGVIYDFASVVYDNDLDVNVLPGARGSGGLVFLVKRNDTNLRLLYRANRFDGEFLALAAEPSAADGLQITATSNLNIRTGPGTTFGVVGSLQAGVPVIALGRNDDGSWVQTMEGWLFTDLLTYEGDVMLLPIVSPN